MRTLLALLLLASVAFASRDSSELAAKQCERHLMAAIQADEQQTHWDWACDLLIAHRTNFSNEARERLALVGSVALSACELDAQSLALFFFEHGLCDREARGAVGVMLDMLEAAKQRDKIIAGMKGLGFSGGTCSGSPESVQCDRTQVLPSAEIVSNPAKID
jgi:hypothetical protein